MDTKELDRIGEVLNCKGTGKPGPCKISQSRLDGAGRKAVEASRAVKHDYDDAGNKKAMLLHLKTAKLHKEAGGGRGVGDFIAAAGKHAKTAAMKKQMDDHIMSWMDK